MAAEPDPVRRGELLDAAGVFFGEALSTFEIAHRGYREVQEVARLEHEHVMQLRALADASVPINATMTTEDVAPAHRRGGARGARRAPRDDHQRRRRPVRARAQRRLAGRRLGPARERRPPIGVMLRSAGRPLGMLEVADRDGARVHPARRGDPRPARPARLGRDRQVAGLHARAPHRPGAAALAAAAEHPRGPGPDRGRPLHRRGRGDRGRRRLLRLLPRARGRRRGADRRRLRQGPGGGVGDRARAPHAARRGGLRVAARAPCSRCCTARCARRATTTASAPSPTATSRCARAARG